MLNGNSRWYLLTGLALGNLLLWVAIAAVVGLLLSDRLDLGLETELRQVEATALSAWNGLSEGARPRPGSSASLPAEPGPTAARPGMPSAGPLPQATPARSRSEAAPARSAMPAGGEPEAGAPPQAGQAVAPQAGQAAAASSPAESPAPGARGVPTRAGGTAATLAEPAGAAAAVLPTPTPALLSKPLLLADPEFHSLSDLNAELARSAPGRVVQIRYQEATLNREVNTLSENNPDLPFSNVRVDLQRNRVVLTGEVTVLGFQVDALVTGTIVARDCRPQIEIESVAVAGVLTPQMVRRQVEEMVLDSMSWYPADYPLCLEQIVLEETRATVYGYHR